MTVIDNAEVKDIAGNLFKVGDIIAFVASGRISFGRVMWFTSKGVTVNEAYFSHRGHVERVKNKRPAEYKKLPEGWYLRKRNFTMWHGALIITMHSLPKEVFELFDNIDFTKGIPKPPKEKTVSSSAVISFVP